MATLTLGKSVTIDAVQSKKGDAVFVERRRRIVAPGSKELREEPKKVETVRSAADEKLRAVLAAAKARDEERKKREAEEEAARKAREAEIERENREYEAVKEQLAARENVTEQPQPVEEVVAVPVRENTHESKKNNVAFQNRNSRRDEDGEDMRSSKQNRFKKDFKKGGKISIHDIVIGGGEDDDDDEIGLRGSERRRSEASLKRFREKSGICSYNL